MAQDTSFKNHRQMMQSVNTQTIQCRQLTFFLRDNISWAHPARRPQWGRWKCGSGKCGSR